MGGSDPPVRIQAACLAAPLATYSPGSGTSTGTASTAGASRLALAHFTPPPTMVTVVTSTPWARTASMHAPMRHSSPSTAALAQLAGVRLARVMPVSSPVASGRLGVRSPSR